MAKQLVEEMGADVNFESENSGWPLQIACRVCDIELVEYLLAQNANPNIETSTSSLLSYLARGVQTVRFRSVVSGDVITDEERLAHQWIEHFEPKEIEIMKMLIDNGGDITYITPEGKSLVQIAQESGSDRMAAMLKKQERGRHHRREEEPLRPIPRPVKNPETILKRNGAAK